MHQTFGKPYTFCIFHAVLGVPFIKTEVCLDDGDARGWAERQPGTIRVFDGHRKVWPAPRKSSQGGEVA